MEFVYIPHTKAREKFEYYIDDQDAFYRFVDDYNVVSVTWGDPEHISASYFLRLLQDGSRVRARGFSRKRYIPENDEYSTDLCAFRDHLLDHTALWKIDIGKVICTALPYGSEEEILDTFTRMVEKFNFPKLIKLAFLDDKYKYRNNGDCLIAIYYDIESDFSKAEKSYSDIKLQNKAIQYSSGPRTHMQTTEQFIRNPWVKKYAKKRANGFCQLCEQPAPFNNKNGEPYLDSHHIISLADGGADSIYNVVALCPNCHRKMHTLNLEEDIEKLKIAASLPL